jgi:hypothetical protein
MRYIKSMGKSFTIDNSKSKKLLGIEYRSLKVSMWEMIEQLIKKGIISKSLPDTL